MIESMNMSSCQKLFNEFGKFEITKKK